MKGLRAAITCAVTFAIGVTVAHAGDPKAAAKQKQAARLFAAGDFQEALGLIEEGLAIEPKNVQLLQLRAAALLELRDYEGALAAYETFLGAGAKGANKRAAQRIVNDLSAVRTTGLELTITGATADDPANVYLDTRSLGVFCVAAPTCVRGLLPGDYKLIVERAGHQKFSERVSIVHDQRLAVERAMTELPSPITITTSADATLTLDGAELGAAPQTTTIPAGDHVVEVHAAGFVTEAHPFAAHRGEPVALELALRPIVPFTVNADGAELLLDGAPAPQEQGALALPAGAVTLTVRADGYRDATVEVPADRAPGYRLDVALERAPAPLTVEGAPPGAKITVDGKVVGTAPLSEPIEVEQGPHDLGVIASGRAAFHTRIEPSSDDPLRLEVDAMPSTRRRWTWVAAGVTGAAVVSWSVFGGLAVSRQSTYDERAREAGITPMDLASLADAGDTYAAVADISMGVAIAAGAVAVWQFLVEGKGESTGRVVPLAGAGGVGVGGTF